VSPLPLRIAEEDSSQRPVWPGRIAAVNVSFKELPTWLAWTREW
jgi:hypothetical protein